MPLGDGNPAVQEALTADAIEESRQMHEQAWLSDYIIGFLKSPSWVSPVMEFIDENCIIFDSDEENKLEYTTKHNDFRLLIDGLLAAHLLEVNIGVSEFEAFCSTGLANGELHHILVEQLLSVDDFLTFKAMMVKKNKELQMQALQELERHEMARKVVSDAVAAEVAPKSPPRGQELGGDTVEEVLSATPSPAGKEQGGTDWGLYEDEEQQLKEALRASEASMAASAEFTDARKEQEEAEMKLAVALSLQVEQQRHSRNSTSSEQEIEESPDTGGASCSASGSTSASASGSASSPVATVDTNEDASPPASVEIISETADADAAEATDVVEAMPEMNPVEVEVPKEEKSEAPVDEKPFSMAEMDALDTRPRRDPSERRGFAMPRMVSLAPTPAHESSQNSKKAPELAPPVFQGSRNVPLFTTTSAVTAVDLKPVDQPKEKGPSPATVHTEPLKASPAPQELCVAVAALPSPARAAAARAAAPSEAELRQRAEHLKKQRELIVAKKKTERERQLQEHKKGRGTWGSRGSRSDAVKAEHHSAASAQLISELTSVSAVPAPAPEEAGEAERASQMRQALTARLKQSLYRSLAA